MSIIQHRYYAFLWYFDPWLLEFVDLQPTENKEGWVYPQSSYRFPIQLLFPFQGKIPPSLETIQMTTACCLAWYEQNNLLCSLFGVGFFRFTVMCVTAINSFFLLYCFWLWGESLLCICSIVDGQLEVSSLCCHKRCCKHSFSIGKPVCVEYLSNSGIVVSKSMWISHYSLRVLLLLFGREEVVWFVWFACLFWDSLFFLFFSFLFEVVLTM